MTVIKKYNENTLEWEAIAVGQKGDTGEGLVTGGTTNQILTKLSNDDFDTQWVSDIDVDSVTQDKAVFNIPLTEFTAPAQGEVQWNLDEGTLELGLDGGSALQVGQEVLYYVKNQTGSTITNGTLVVASGTLGNSGRILIAPWTGSEAPQTLMGLATQDIATGEDGYVAHFGKVRDIDTTGTPYSETWADGDILYAGPSGGLTNVKPTAPNSKAVVALVIHAQDPGTLFVRTTISPSLGFDDLVELSTLSDNDILRYNSANERFENESLGTAADADTGDFATSAQGSLADTAVQPGDIGTIASQDANSVNIDGGTIDGTAVNATTLTASGDVNFDSGTLFVDESTDRVGIGTTGPVAILTASNSGALTLNSNDGDHSGFGLFLAPETISANAVNSAIGFGDAGAGRKYAAIGMQTYADVDQTGLNFYVQPITSGSIASLTEAMRIDSSGNVGIGTTAPDSKLHVEGSVRFNGALDGNNFRAGIGNLTVDADNEFTPGTYRWNSDSTNTPVSNKFYSVVIYGQPGQVIAQMATQLITADTYIRTFNVSWSAWRRVI